MDEKSQVLQVLLPEPSRCHPSWLKTFTWLLQKKLRLELCGLMLTHFSKISSLSAWSSNVKREPDDRPGCHGAFSSEESDYRSSCILVGFCFPFHFLILKQNKTKPPFPPLLQAQDCFTLGRLVFWPLRWLHLLWCCVSVWPLWVVWHCQISTSFSKMGILRVSVPLVHKPKHLLVWLYLKRWLS
jgi:hypothetical protein